MFLWLYLDSIVAAHAPDLALIYDNKIRIENNYETYPRRHAIMEHPYGLIKRQWDFYYIMTKNPLKERVRISD